MNENNLTVGAVYVLDNTEVKLTGRMATRSLTSGRSLTKIEVTPVDPEIGQWKKWVTYQELYTITPLKDTNDTDA